MAYQYQWITIYKAQYISRYFSVKQTRFKFKHPNSLFHYDIARSFLPSIRKSGTEYAANIIKDNTIEYCLFLRTENDKMIIQFVTIPYNSLNHAFGAQQMCFLAHQCNIQTFWSPLIHLTKQNLPNSHSWNNHSTLCCSFPTVSLEKLSWVKAKFCAWYGIVVTAPSVRTDCWSASFATADTLPFFHITGTWKESRIQHDVQSKCEPNIDKSRIYDQHGILCYLHHELPVLKTKEGKYFQSMFNTIKHGGQW